MVVGESGVATGDLLVLLRSGTGAGFSDGELLDRFARGPGESAESAFAALVVRHGPMVWRACRRVLDDPNDAEDAVQATFLVLALRARAVRDRDSLASWLFGVARRASAKARVAAARRKARERKGAERAGPRESIEPPEGWSDLHEEVDRLPEIYRNPVILCYFEGLTHEEAAERLALPLGTLKIRLSRARDRLRVALTRRGLAPSPLLVAAPGSGTIPGPLARSIVSASLRAGSGRALAASMSSAVSQLANGVIRAMLLTKLKAVLALASGLTVSAAATLLVALAFAAAPSSARSDQDPAPENPAAPRPGSTIPDPPVDRASKPDQAPAAPPPTAEKPRRVVVEAAKMLRTSRTGDMVASVEPARSVDLRPRISGYVKGLAVDVGDRVRAGDLLAEVASPEAEADRERGEAIVERAGARLASARASVAVGQASLAAAKAHAEAADETIKGAEATLAAREKDLRRVKEMIEQRIVGQHPLDEANDRVEAARATLAEAKARARAGVADVEKATAEQEVAKAGIAEAQADLRVARAEQDRVRLPGQDFARIAAPFDGVVAARNVGVGDFVRAGGADVLFRIIDTRRVRVVFDVAAGSIPSLKPGDVSTLHFNAYPDAEFRGRVARISPEINPGTGTFRATVDLDNADGRLRSGMSGIVSVDQDREPILTIPSSAIVMRNGKAECYRAEGGRAVLARIKVGKLGRARTQVLDGLKEGDAVILGAGVSLKDGEPIEIEPAARP